MTSQKTQQKSHIHNSRQNDGEKWDRCLSTLALEIYITVDKIRLTARLLSPWFSSEMLLERRCFVRFFNGQQRWQILLNSEQRGWWITNRPTEYKWITGPVIWYAKTENCIQKPFWTKTLQQVYPCNVFGYEPLNYYPPTNQVWQSTNHTQTMLFIKIKYSLQIKGISISGFSLNFCNVDHVCRDFKIENWSRK